MVGGVRPRISDRILGTRCAGEPLHRRAAVTAKVAAGRIHAGAAPAQTWQSRAAYGTDDRVSWMLARALRAGDWRCFFHRAEASSILARARSIRAGRRPSRSEDAREQISLLDLDLAHFHAPARLRYLLRPLDCFGFRRALNDVVAADVFFRLRVRSVRDRAAAVGTQFHGDRFAAHAQAMRQDQFAVRG